MKMKEEAKSIDANEPSLDSELMSRLLNKK
jgi:hypothetical protein